MTAMARDVISHSHDATSDNTECMADLKSAYVFMAHFGLWRKNRV
jgi:hypothetical protein